MEPIYVAIVGGLLVSMQAFLSMEPTVGLAERIGIAALVFVIIITAGVYFQKYSERV